MCEFFKINKKAYDEIMNSEELGLFYIDDAFQFFDNNDIEELDFSEIFEDIATEYFYSDNYDEDEEEFILIECPFTDKTHCPGIFGKGMISKNNSTCQDCVLSFNLDSEFNNNFYLGDN